MTGTNRVKEGLQLAGGDKSGQQPAIWTISCWLVPRIGGQILRQGGGELIIAVWETGIMKDKNSLWKWNHDV